MTHISKPLVSGNSRTTHRKYDWVGKHESLVNLWLIESNAWYIFVSLCVRLQQVDCYYIYSSKATILNAAKTRPLSLNSWKKAVRIVSENKNVGKLLKHQLWPIIAAAPVLYTRDWFSQRKHTVLACYKKDFVLYIWNTLKGVWILGKREIGNSISFQLNEWIHFGNEVIDKIMCVCCHVWVSVCKCDSSQNSL